EARLGKTGHAFLQELAQEIVFDPSVPLAKDIDTEIVETLRAACAEGQVVEMEYASVASGTKRRRKVGPEFLYFAKGSLYLIARDLEDQQPKVFAVPRMAHALMLDQSYEAGSIQPETFFSNSFGFFQAGHPEDIRIRFS